MTFSSYPVVGSPIPHLMWRALLSGTDGISDPTTGLLGLTLSSVSDVATVGTGRYTYRGFQLDVTVPHGLTLAPATTTPKTYQIGVMYNPADESLPAGPLSLQGLLKTAITPPSGGSWTPLHEVTRTAATVLSASTATDLRRWAMTPAVRIDTGLPPAAESAWGQVLIQDVGAAGLDVAVRRGGIGAETWKRMLGPSWTNCTLTSGYVALSPESVPRFTISGGLTRFEGAFKRSPAQPFYASHGTYTNVGAVPIQYAPERVIAFASIRNDAGMIVNTDGKIDLDINEDTTYVRADASTWFPKG
jgi:hypothetical protein